MKFGAESHVSRRVKPETSSVERQASSVKRQTTNVKRHASSVKGAGKSLTTILRELKAQGNPSALEAMARFGLTGRRYGVKVPVLRKMAREIGKHHTLALELWETGIAEARILASMIDDPKQVTPKQMDRWVQDFDAWDVCDQACMNLFDKTPLAGGERRTKFCEKGGQLGAARDWQAEQESESQVPRFLRRIKQGPPRL